LAAEIRAPSDKSDELRFGWDGTTALGGAVVDSQPARMLDEIRAVGEDIPDECEIFNANLEMDGSDLMFADVMELVDKHYENQLLEFTNGDLVNKAGENDGSAKVLSYAALSNLDKETTLKLFGEHYRAVKATPDGTDHQNIRNFMKTGWEGAFLLCVVIRGTIRALLCWSSLAFVGEEAGGDTSIGGFYDYSVACIADALCTHALLVTYGRY
jgi:hypothetical protein